MTVIIDYKAGNLYNVGNALKALRTTFRFSNDPKVVSSAKHVILPGQGSAGPAMESLNEYGLVDVLRRLQVPFLGICLGLQLLFEHSDEDATPCLGLFPGTVRKFGQTGLKVPQIGWNRVRRAEEAPAPGLRLLEGIEDDSYFYFAHSYYAPVTPPLTVGVSEYSLPFSSVVARGNFLGVQFHPERSGEVGLRLLENFIGERP